MVSGFNILSGIMRTVLNQFDSLVRPLQRWLVERGVQFVLDTKVLFGLDRKPPAVYKGNHDPRILLKSFLALQGKADWEALLDS